jgi:hypothetical protein
MTYGYVNPLKVQDGYHYLLKACEVLGINEDESAFCGSESAEGHFRVATTTDLQEARVWFQEGVQELVEAGVTFDQTMKTGTRATLAKSLALALLRVREACRKAEVDPHRGQSFEEIAREEAQQEAHFKARTVQAPVEAPVAVQAPSHVMFTVSHQEGGWTKVEKFYTFGSALACFMGKPKNHSYLGVTRGDKNGLLMYWFKDPDTGKQTLSSSCSLDILLETWGA